MATTHILGSDVRRVALAQPIRELIDLYPATMPVLAAHGIDLCCGGGHTVGEAAALHGLEAEALLDQLVTATTTTTAAATTTAQAEAKE